MKLITEKLSEVITEELAKSAEDKTVQNLGQLLIDLQKAGLIKQPNYNLPLVDTIGKTYYSSINKRD